MKLLSYKRLLATCALPVLLAGCVAVPYDQPYYATDAMYGMQPYALAPGYPSAPVYAAPGYAPPGVGAPVYVGPPVQFSFGLGYHSGHYGGYGGHHRHFGSHHFGHHHFGGHGGPGWHR